jgi:hypothetical protein
VPITSSATSSLCRQEPQKRTSFLKARPDLFPREFGIPASIKSTI